jgi:hypothetical protein
MLGMLKRHEVEILLKAGKAKTEAARLSGVSLRLGTTHRGRVRWGRLMRRRSAPNGRSAGPARSRISGNRWSRSCRASGKSSQGKLCRQTGN